MIAFQSLFLGLVFGLGSVRVMVSPPVATVEIVLDGASLGTLRAKPWELPCNFGPAPLPHELVAVGRNAAGDEVARVRQWVNLPRPSAEARILVERDAAGKPANVRLAWSTIDNAKPKRFEVALDGKDLAVRDPVRSPLPDTDLRQPHFLTAEVIFPKGVVARAEASFGGDLEAKAGAELTAVPVVLRPHQVLPTADEMQQWFRANGEPVQVLAVEDGHADVVMVFDQDTAGRFGGISRGDRNSTILAYSLPIQPSTGGNRLSGLWAVPGPTGGAETHELRAIFPMSFPLDLDVDGVRTLIFRFPFPAANAQKQELANAVATGGMFAAALNRRRAVVLMVGKAAPDVSTLSVKAARAYLESLDVPLFIWTPERRIAEMGLPGWGVPEDVSTDLQLQGAMARLQTALADQRIVWLAGSYLPQSITVAPGIVQVFLPRGVVRGERPAHHS